MAILFEYGKWENGISDIKALKQMLKDIWAQDIYTQQEVELTENEKDKRYQPFLNFDGDWVRANNYVGFIQNNDEVIEIYPKVKKS
jgi:5-methylcytosine-specific restriction enzyme subunit McrC